MNEGKKDRRDPIRTIKAKNPVAKNASAAIGGGAAGAHKDKKKAMKQGEVKHKKAEYAESYEQHLQNKLDEAAKVDPNAPFDYDKWKSSGKTTTPKHFGPKGAGTKLAQQTRDAEKKKEQGVAEGLESYPEVLYHGSTQEIKGPLTPRQSHDIGGAPGSNKNAIYATDDPNFAIAYSLAQRGSDTGTLGWKQDPHLIFFGGKIRHGQNAYIHVLPTRDQQGQPLFVRGDADAEWYSRPEVKAIKPIKVEVKPVDQYLHLLRKPTPEEQKLFQANKDKAKQGVAEGKSAINFSADDLKRLEKIRDLPTLKAQAFELISKPSAKPMKPEKVEWFKQALENMNSPIKVIKLMYDLLLSGEGNAVVGSKSSMNPNSYRQRFGEQGMAEEMDIPQDGTPEYDQFIRRGGVNQKTPYDLGGADAYYDRQHDITQEYGFQKGSPEWDEYGQGYRDTHSNKDMRKDYGSSRSAVQPRRITRTGEAMNGITGPGRMDGPLESEGDKEGLPHLTKELASHIAQQIDTEGAHAIVKSVTWGDGAADDLVQFIKKALETAVGGNVAEGTARDKWNKASDGRKAKHDKIEADRKAAAAQGKTDVKGAVDRLEKAVNGEGWTHDSLADRLFEHERTYEEKLQNQLNKRLGK